MIFKLLNNYRLSQVITELTLIIKLKRHIEPSFEVKEKIYWFIQREIKTKINLNNDSPNYLLNTKNKLVMTI